MNWISFKTVVSISVLSVVGNVCFCYLRGDEVSDLRNVVTVFTLLARLPENEYVFVLYLINLLI